MSVLNLGDLGKLAWEDLGRFKEAGSFPVDYPADRRTFYSPRDPGVHQVILWTLLQAQHSIVFNVYGFDDDDAATVIFKAARDPQMYVQGSLDKSQAGGVHERKLLAEAPDLVGASVAIGHSEKGAISHDKMLLVDGLYLGGSSETASETRGKEKGRRKPDGPCPKELPRSQSSRR